MQPIVAAHHGSEMFLGCGGQRLVPNGLARLPHHGLHGPSLPVFSPSASRSHGTPSSSSSSTGLASVGRDIDARSPHFNSPPPGFAAKTLTMPPGVQLQRHQNAFMADMAAALASAQAPSTPATSAGSGSPEMSVYYPQHQLLTNSIDPQSMIDPGTAGAGGCSAVTMATAVEAWRTLNAVHHSAAVAAALAGYGAPCHDPVQLPFGYQQYAPGYGGIDVRRKNATRESTSTLKAWLYEHIKNPYPTKGEKIMLAIVTRMTLTQVSTWFANARRRLKKENKMQWSPRNRTGDDDDEDDDEDDGLLDNCNNNNNGAGDEYMARSHNVDDRSRQRIMNDDDVGSEDDDVVVDVDNEDFSATRHSPLKPTYAHFRSNIEQLPLAVCGRPTAMSPLYRPEVERGIAEPQPEQQRPETKPRIWSLADIATSGTNTSSSSSSYHGLNSSPRASLGALWGNPSSLSPLLSTRFQPWTGCSSTSVQQPLPSSSSLFQNGLFPVGGFLHPSSPDSKSPQPSRSDSAAAGVEMRSTSKLSPTARRTLTDDVGGSSSSRVMSRDPVAICDDDERR